MNRTYDYWFILLISIFFGFLGIDRFIIGDYKTGLFKLCTFGFCGILWMVDILAFATKSVPNIHYTTSDISKKVGLSIIIGLFSLSIFIKATFFIFNMFIPNKINDNNYATEITKKTESPIPTKTPIKVIPTKTAKSTVKHTLRPTVKLTVKPTVNTPAPVKKYIVTLTNMTLISNNSVGNDWCNTILINGSKIDLYKSIEFNTHNLNAGILIVENDKIPDVGQKNVNLKKGINTINIDVVENRGRYSGNVATWQVILKVEYK